MVCYRQSGILWVLFTKCCCGQAQNLLNQFPSFCAFKKNGCNLAIRFEQATHVSPATLSWAYQLCEQNMRTMYEDVWGWKPSEKQKELKHPDARYLIVYDVHEAPVGYLHFRYPTSSQQCLYDDQPYLYQPAKAMLMTQILLPTKAQPSTITINHNRQLPLHLTLSLWWWYYGSMSHVYSMMCI